MVTEDVLNSWGVKAKSGSQWPSGAFQRGSWETRPNCYHCGEKLEDLLAKYRTIPHRMTGETPAILLMQREFRTKLLSIQAQKSTSDTAVHQEKPQNR